jgi:hypothetical protein
MNSKMVNMEAQLLSRMIITEWLNSGAVTTRRSIRNTAKRQSLGRALWFVVGLSVIPVAFFAIVAFEMCQ